MEWIHVANKKAVFNRRQLNICMSWRPIDAGTFAASTFVIAVDKNFARSAEPAAL